MSSPNPDHIKASSCGAAGEDAPPHVRKDTMHRHSRARLPCAGNVSCAHAGRPTAGHGSSQAHHDFAAFLDQADSRSASGRMAAANTRHYGRMPTTAASGGRVAAFERGWPASASGSLGRTQFANGATRIERIVDHDSGNWAIRSAEPCAIAPGNGAATRDIA